MNDNAKNMIAITIQNTIALLGPMPDKLGDKVKGIIDGDDLIAVMALGCSLEDYQKKGRYPDVPMKVSVRMTIEKEIPWEEVQRIENDEDLEKITVAQYYETLYKTELRTIATPNEFEIIRVKVN